MKKICYVTTISLTIKAFFTEQLRYLSKNGYDVTVICSYDECLQEQLGKDIRYIPIEITRGISVGNLIKVAHKLFNIFRKEKFDLVQYSTPNAALCASAAAAMAKIKIRNYHCMGFRYIGAGKFLKIILKMLEKITCKFSTHIECVSKSNLEFGVMEYIFDETKATVVWNGSSGGIDLERFNYDKREEWHKEKRLELRLNEDDFVFGFVGRITKDKGLNEIFKAFSKITDNNVKLVIVGPNEGNETLNQELLSSMKDDSRVIFCGSKQDVEKYYSAMDVLLLPSYREGFGMVIAEAAAMGTPAIVSNIPGPIDVILNEKTALVTEVKNADSLYEKMNIFIKNKDLCKQMSKECVAFIKSNFDSKILCEKILERKTYLINEVRNNDIS